MWKNSQWVNFVLTTYTLDVFRPNAHLISIVSLIDTAENGNWENYEQQFNTYNANGNLLTQVIQSWSGSQWNTSSSDTSTYDANGNQLTNLNEDWNNGQVTDFNSDTCTYDGSGHKLIDISDNNYSEFLSRTFYTYTYDQTGNQISALSQIPNSGEWMNFMLNTYTYDANGNQLLDSNYVWGGQWIFSQYESKTYDGNGHLLSDSSESSEGGNLLMLYSLKTYTYDGNGNLVSSSSESLNGLSLAPSDNSVQISNGSNPPTVTFYYGYYVNIAYTLIDAVPITDVSAPKSNVPSGFSLSQNYPNPFNPTTTIAFNIPSKSFVSLKVFDMLGKEVATLASEEMSTGNYTRQWNAVNVSSGMYFYRLQAGTFTETKKLVLLK